MRRWPARSPRCCRCRIRGSRKGRCRCANSRRRRPTDTSCRWARAACKTSLPPGPAGSEPCMVGLAGERRMRPGRDARRGAGAGSGDRGADAAVAAVMAGGALHVAGVAQAACPAIGGDVRLDERRAGGRYARRGAGEATGLAGRIGAGVRIAVGAGQRARLAARRSASSCSPDTTPRHRRGRGGTWRRRAGERRICPRRGAGGGAGAGGGDRGSHAAVAALHAGSALHGAGAARAAVPQSLLMNGAMSGAQLAGSHVAMPTKAPDWQVGSVPACV